MSLRVPTTKSPQSTFQGLMGLEALDWNGKRWKSRLPRGTWSLEGGARSEWILGQFLGNSPLTKDSYIFPSTFPSDGDILGRSRAMRGVWTLAPGPKRAPISLLGGPQNCSGCATGFILWLLNASNSKNGLWSSRGTRSPSLQKHGYRWCCS